MRRSFKYRLFTNVNQERELGIMLETHRRLYNECLSLRQMTWDCYRENFSFCDCDRWYKGQRRVNPYFARLNFSSAEGTMRRLDRSFANFFRRLKAKEKPGYPRFKGRDFFNSIEFTHYLDGCRLTGNRLYVQHVGTIRVKLHRPVEGKIKTVAVKREAGKWYAVFSCDLGEVPITPSTLPPVGIDMGLTNFLTTSDGKTEENPRYLDATLPALRRANRSVARKLKGGRNRRKAVRILQRVHARVRNQRREHHYQVACRLVLAYGLIAVESLNILGMLRNGGFSLAIIDAGWAGFLNVLRGKAEKTGAVFVEVDPRGTSQTCTCGQEVRKQLRDRWHECPACGLSLPRDQVSAQIILSRGLAVRTAPPGANVGHKVKRPPRSLCRKAKV